MPFINLGINLHTYTLIMVYYSYNNIMLDRIQNFNSILNIYLSLRHYSLI